MDAAQSGHPTRKVLSSFGLGKLDDRSAQAVGNHLEQCPECRQQVAGMSADSFLGRVRDAQGPAMSTYDQSQASGSASGQAGPKAVAPPPTDTLPPGLVDHPDYEIKRELGRGGMGVVYLAHNRLMGRDEVLKVMGRHIMDRPGVLDRFVREIRAVARLRHSNIVTAYHATRLGDSVVFAMEYVDGLDLSRMVKAKGPLPVSHACNFVYQAALGLQHAHEEGLVHRDIKPGNLMLARKGDKSTIKILDFGLAKASREQKVDGALTNEGQALGTPDFIAPEQIVNAPNVDIRADIYSLGGTLYYLLTGRPPFHANSLYDIYQAHMSRDADPLNLIRPEVPVELAALVAKMMTKEPERRFQTPGEIAGALAPLFKRESLAFKGAASPVPNSRQTRTEVSGQHLDLVAPPATSQAAHPIAGVAKATVPAAPEVRWESLIDVTEDGPQVDQAKGKLGEPSSANLKPAPADRAIRRRAWSWLAAVAGSKGRNPGASPSGKWRTMIAASLLGIAVLGVIICVATDNGYIKIETDDPNATVKLDGEAIVIEALKAPIRIHTGVHILEVKQGQSDTEKRPIILRRGETKTERFTRANEPLTGMGGMMSQMMRSQASNDSPPARGMMGMGEGTTGPTSKDADRPGTGMMAMMPNAPASKDSPSSGTMGMGMMGMMAMMPNAPASKDSAAPSGGTMADMMRGMTTGPASKDADRPGMGMMAMMPNAPVSKDSPSGGTMGVSMMGNLMQTAADLLREGTVWKGVLTYIEPKGFAPDFLVELSIKKRQDNRFEGVYSADKSAHICEVIGTIDGDRIAWEKTKGIKGGMLALGAVAWSGTITHDRIDIKGEHSTTDGRPARCNGFFLLTTESGELPAIAPRHSELTVKDLLEAGTVWKGLGSYRYPANYPSVFTIELTITKRAGNTFEGVYKGDRARVKCTVTGSVTTGTIVFKVTDVLAGRIDPTSVVTGIISGDRIETESKHSTPEGQPALWKGTWIRLVAPDHP
jgi:serine/threonine protein kinase